MEPGWFVSDSTGAKTSRYKSSLLSCHDRSVVFCRGRRVLSCRARPARPVRHGTNSTFSYRMDPEGCCVLVDPVVFLVSVATRKPR
jgi:hypothetical protein